MIFNPMNEKTNFKKIYFWNANLIFSEKINIRAGGGEPAMVLRYLEPNFAAH